MTTSDGDSVIPASSSCNSLGELNYLLCIESLQSHADSTGLDLELGRLTTGRLGHATILVGRRQEEEVEDDYDDKLPSALDRSLDVSQMPVKRRTR